MKRRAWRRGFRCAGMLATLLVAPPLAAQTLSFEQRLEQLCEALEQRRVAQHVPGMGLAVVKDDRVVLARGFGARDVARGLPATAETLFAIGSTTKAFTAMLAAMLVDEGKLQWDDPVQRHVPFFAVADTEVSARITIRDLLCHRTGVPRESILWYPGVADAEAILHQVREAQLNQPFRKVFQYNNVMYLAAGHATQCAAGVPWGELLEQRILGPLGMSRSGISVPAALADPDHAVGYAWREDTGTLEPRRMRSLTNIAPAGAINSSARDMSQWVLFLLRRGQGENGTLVRAERLDEMWTAQDIPGASYGLGWFVQSWQGKPYVEHGGNIDGFAATVGVLPEERLGYVLLTNLDTPPIQQEMPALVWSTLLGSGPDPAGSGVVLGRPGAPMSAGELEPYLGRYRVAGLDEAAEVKLVDGRLTLKVPFSPELALSWPDTAGRWAVQNGAPAYAEFESTEKGFISAIRVFQGSTLAVPSFRRIESEDPLPLTSDELLEQVREALGSDAAGELPPFVLRGTIRHLHQGLAGELLTFVDGPDRLAQLVDYGAFGSTRRFHDGGTGGDQPLGAPLEPLSGAAAEKLRNESPLALFGEWFDFYEDVEVVRADQVQGRDVFLVRLTAPTGAALTRVIDAETGTVFQDRGAAVFTGMPTEGLTLEYGDYREVAGVRMPFRVTVELPAHGTTVVQYEECELDPEVPEGWFDTDGGS